MTGLLFCFYIKLFLLSIFNSVNFGSSMSCIVLDVEIADERFIRELVVFIDENIQGCSFHPAKKYKPTKQAFWCTRNFHGILLISECLDHNELENILPRAAKWEFVAKRRKSARLLAFSRIESCKRWKIMALPKVKILQKQMKKSRFARITHLDPRLHIIVQNAKRNDLLTEESKI